MGHMEKNEGQMAMVYDVAEAQRRAYDDLDDFRWIFEAWISAVLKRLKSRPTRYWLKESPPHVFAEVGLPKGLYEIHPWEDGDGAEYVYRFTIPVLFSQVGRTTDDEDNFQGGYIRFAVKIGIGYNFDKNTIFLQYIEVVIDRDVGFNPPITIEELFGELFEKAEDELDAQINEYNGSAVFYSFAAFQTAMSWFFKKLRKSIGALDPHEMYDDDDEEEEDAENNE